MSTEHPSGVRGVGAIGAKTAVIFDIGNVLIPWNIAWLVERHVTDRQQARFVCERVLTTAVNHRLDLGETYAEVMPELRRRFPDHHAVIDAFEQNWIETLGDPLSDNVAVRDDLRFRGVPTFALTNFGLENWERCMLDERFVPVLDGFDDIVVSGRVRLGKPDPAIYRLALDRFRFAAADVVFIDDSPVNVAAARDLGIASVLYRPETDLRDELRRWFTV